MNRFTVKEYGEIEPGNGHIPYSDNRYYAIMDSLAVKFNMPSKAVSIYFNNVNIAIDICDKLNTEWAQFLINPK